MRTDSSHILFIKRGKMKEVNTTTSINLEGYNPITGEVFEFEAISNTKEKYYSISNITTRINNMDFLSKMEKICKSSKDITIVKYLLELHGNDNYIRISNISNLAKQLKVSRRKLTDILKRMETSDLVLKTDRGIYMINPFIWIGKRVRTNLLREQAQNIWEQHHIKKEYKNEKD